MDDQPKSKSNRHTWHVDHDPHRRHPSYRKDVGDGGVLSTKPAVKRLFSDRSQTAEQNDGVEQFEDAENGYEPDQEGEPFNSSRKRHRSGEWPLPSSSTQDATPRAPLQSRAGAPNSAQYPRRTSSVQPRNRGAHQRASSFVEGSMNDRASIPPPASYTDHEDHMDRYVAEQQTSTRIGYTRTDSGSFVPQQDGFAAPSSTAAKPETQKSNTMVRFGMNMISAFNPSTWKQRFSKSTKDSKAESSFEVATTKEAYEQLKASANFKSHTVESSRFPKPSARPHQRPQTTAPNQSTISLIDPPRPETPKKEKRYGRLYEDAPSVFEDPEPRAPSPSSMSQSSHVTNNQSTGKRRSSFSFKKPNFTRHSHSRSTSELPLTNPQSLNKIPSKKQIADEQKLVKKMSNLESQMMETRRQYAALTGEPLPLTTMARLEKTLNERPPVEFSKEPPRVGRRLFVPGSLATLPSERLLTDYAEEEEADEFHEALSTNEDKLEAAVSVRAIDSYSPGLQAKKDFVARAVRNSRLSSVSIPNPLDAEIVSSTLPETRVGEVAAEEEAALRADNEVSDPISSSSLDESVVTGDTVIHHVESSQQMLGMSLQNGPYSTMATDDDLPIALENESQAGLQEDVDCTPKAEPAKRKVSGKRKSTGNEDDYTYKPSKSESDDDEAWEQASKYSTPRKNIPRPNLKKQKTSATDSPLNRIGKKASFDSPKGSFISSTKQPKRASTSTPPKPSVGDSPKGAFVSSTKFAKRTSVPSSPKETKRKSISQLAPPPSSSFTFTSGTQVRPGTPGLAAPGKKPVRPVQKRPGSPNLAAKSSAQAQQVGLAMSNYAEDAGGVQDAIPPVPRLSREILKKHQETSKVKQKKLTIEDIHRRQKASSIGSSAHPHQDVARKSIEKEGTVKSAKSREANENDNDNDFHWDDDVF